MTLCVRHQVNAVSDDDRTLDPVQTLTTHAEHLNAISSPGWPPKIFYEIMSGGLVWSDETTSKTPTEVIWALRPIFAYRTSLMLGKPREELQPMWNLGLSRFPKWVGFRPDRRQATPELLLLYRRGDVSLRKCLRDLERKTDEEHVEPDAASRRRPRYCYFVTSRLGARAPLLSLPTASAPAIATSHLRR